MADISVDFLGFSLKNPLMLTEGPLSGSYEQISKASGFNIGLIFTKGVRLKAAASPVPYMSKYRSSLLNADWSDIGFESWLEVLRKLDIDIPLVTSIAKNYISSDLAVEMAQDLVKAGSKIISFVDYDARQLIETVTKARPLLKVPIMVKLPPFLPELEETLKKLVKAGVDAIAAMDSIGPVLGIDIETGSPLMGSNDGSGYLSGNYILPVTLKYIYEISGFVDVPVVGVGGVSNYESAVEMIMAGASGVGMVTAPLLKGLGVFDQVAGDLEDFLEKKEWAGPADFRGLTRRKIEERRISTDLRAVIDQKICTACGLCEKICYSGVVYRQDGSYQVKREKCIGCGLCRSVCAAGAINFT